MTLPTRLRRMLLMLLYASCPAGAFAQAPVPVTAEELIGERLRVRIVDGFDPLVGTVVDQEAGILRLRDDEGRMVSVDPVVVASVERSVGQGTNAGKGLLIGAGVGAALGTVGGLVVEQLTCGASPCDNEGSMYVVGTGAAALLVGGLVGALVGAGQSSDRWMPLWVRSTAGTLRLDMDVSPSGGIALIASWPIGSVIDEPRPTGC